MQESKGRSWSESEIEDWVKTIKRIPETVSIIDKTDKLPRGKWLLMRVTAYYLNGFASHGYVVASGDVLGHEGAERVIGKAFSVYNVFPRGSTSEPMPYYIYRSPDKVYPRFDPFGDRDFRLLKMFSDRIERTGK